MSQSRDVTLQQKIGQMLVVGFDGIELKHNDAIVTALMAQQLGGVILFDYNYKTKKFERNIKNPQQLKQLTAQLQDYAAQAAKAHQNELVPLFIGVDYEGGSVSRLKENVGFPKTVSAADIGTMTDEKAIKYAESMAKTLNEVGINLNFAPVLDVNTNHMNPIIGKLGRSFSNDPKKVAHFARLFSAAYQQRGIVSVYKHFPGHGSSTTDSHLDFVDVTHTWCENELLPYRLLLSTSDNCSMVMTAHVVHMGLDPCGYPASISHAITTTLLREKLQFDGVVVTDDMQMKAISDKYSLEEAVCLAVNAGADILVFGNQLVLEPQDPAQLIEIITQNVKNGNLSEDRINQSYQRIMKLKSFLPLKETRHEEPVSLNNSFTR